MIFWKHFLSSIYYCYTEEQYDCPVWRHDDKPSVIYEKRQETSLVEINQRNPYVSWQGIQMSFWSHPVYEPGFGKMAAGLNGKPPMSINLWYSWKQFLSVSLQHSGTSQREHFWRVLTWYPAAVLVFLMLQITQ